MSKKKENLVLRIEKTPRSEKAKKRASNGRIGTSKHYI